MNLGATTWMALDENSTVEIVGFIIDNVLYTGKSAYIAFKMLRKLDGIYTKEMAQFMACLDLGKRWDDLQNAPTILIWDKGQPRLPWEIKNV